MHRFAQSFWLLMLPFIAYVYLLFGAWGLLQGESGAVLDIGGAVLVLFAISLRNAWRLVVNVEQQGP
jgi:Sec-independent protein secretion pathway component TatC